MCSVLIPCETISNNIVLVLGLDGDFELGVKGVKGLLLVVSMHLIILDIYLFMFISFVY